MKTKITHYLKYWFFIPIFLMSLTISAQGTILEDICSTIPNTPILKETIATYPLTDLSDATGNNNTEIIPGVSISDTDGLCLDNGIVDNFDNLESTLLDPDLLGIISGFDVTPVEDNFDPNNFGVKLDFNLSYYPPIDVESDGVVNLGVSVNPYLEFLGIVYNIVTEQVGVLLESGNILYADVNVPLNQWHTVEVKYLGGEGFVYLNGELVLAINGNAIDEEAIDISQFDVSQLTIEGALEFITQYAGLGDGYEFCLRNIEIYKCDLGATEVPSITEECSVSLDAPTAYDICSGTVVGTTEDPVEYTMAGNYVVNWSFTSANGATSMYSQSVTVTASPENDSDGDGVCDEFDICPGFDDNIDVDENGTPDGCDEPDADNEPSDNVNLALLDDATLSGSVPDGAGRGTPLAILYDPLIDDYRIRTKFNEYGVAYQENLGTPDADNGFFWRVDWETPKAVNYITIGGTYPNQPQPNSLWRVSYLYNGEWTTLEEGVGGWIDSGIYVYDGTAMMPIIADAFRIQVFSDGVNDLVSIHLRGRGGRSSSVNDSATTPKATLFMYLPQPGIPVADFSFETNLLDVDFDASASTDDVGIVDYTVDFGDGNGISASGSPTTFSHTYASPGTYDVTLTVVDGDGNENSITKQVTVTDGSSVNEPNENVNLALLDDATLSGSVPDGDGRGTPDAILYDPLIDDYHIRTDWNEYGVEYLDNLGRPDADNGFLWQVDWAAPKLINYVTIGGTYPNQPQYGALWRISYLNGGEWITLDEGLAGWINSGIFVWDGRDESPIEADAFRVQVYSDGNSDLISIHLRGRGGISNRVNDSATTPKATLIQYLPPVEPPVFTEVKSVNKMRVSPNPLSNRAKLSFDEVTDVEIIEIYDLTGRQVQQIKGGKIDEKGKQIYVYGLPQGIYNLKAITKSGAVHQQKLIIKK